MKYLSSPPHIALSVFIFLLSAPLGLATYTFYYADGFSYFSKKPETCINCHIMKDQYNAWNKGSHHGVATCNDCHSPSGFVAKYINKASNGFWHSLAFTNGRFTDPIQIKPHNREIVEAACITCHENLVGASHFGATNLNEKSCLHCHRSVGHDLRK